jgi:hypothetical protein
VTLSGQFSMARDSLAGRGVAGHEHVLTSSECVPQRFSLSGFQDAAREKVVKSEDGHRRLAMAKVGAITTGGSSPSKRSPV